MSAKSRPEHKNRKLACENSQFQIFFDELAYQGRTTVKDYLVVAPKRVISGAVSGVAILPICNKKIALIRVYRHPISDCSWEIPRGFIDEGESAIAAAIRELNEETRLDCQPEQMRSLGLLTPDTGILAARLRLFAALECERARAYAPAELGHQELRFFELDEIEKMILASEVQDPSTIAAYFIYVRLLNSPGDSL
jgi:ADP-ribose pyrophosphatase